MTCDQARELLEEHSREENTCQDLPELAEHLAGCQACQVWYAEYRQVDEALHRLPTFPSPPDFSQRVLARLSQRARRGELRADPGNRVTFSRWRQRLQAFRAGLDHPRGRRQLVPALVAAACVVLVAGLLYGLLASDVPPVAGAATGSVPGVLAAGAGLVLIVLLVGLILWRRRR